MARGAHARHEALVHDAPEALAVVAVKTARCSIAAGLVRRAARIALLPRLHDAVAAARADPRTGAAGGARAVVAEDAAAAFGAQTDTIAEAARAPAVDKELRHGRRRAARADPCRHHQRESAHAKAQGARVHFNVQRQNAARMPQGRGAARHLQRRVRIGRAGAQAVDGP
jgi:hypothetical protein